MSRVWELSYIDRVVRWLVSLREGSSIPPPTGQSPAGPPSEFERFALAASAGPRGRSLQLAVSKLLVGLLLAACGDDGPDPIPVEPRLVPLSTPAVSLPHGECVDLGARSVLAVSPEGDLWLIEGTTLSVVSLDGTEATYEEDAVMADVFAKSATAIAYAADGLFHREGEFVDTIPWPMALGAPTLVCGDPTRDRDGFVVAGDLFQRAGGQWWRWFPAEGDFGDILDVPKTLGACRGERGETWLHTSTGLWRVRDEGLDRVEDLPTLIEAELGLGFEAAALTEDGLYFGPDEWYPTLFEAGAPTMMESTGRWLYVKAGERFYRFADLLGERVQTVELDVDPIAMHGWSEGLWLETDGQVCSRREDEALLTVRGIRSFERRAPSSLLLRIEGSEAPLTIERDGMMVHESPAFAGSEEVGGIYGGDPGWHTLDVSVGDSERSFRYEVVTNSGATYVDDIAPLFETNCAGSECHGADRDDVDRPDLSTYEGWVNASRAIRNRVGRVRDMPPFEERLETWDAEEVTLVVAWIDEGMVRGE